MAAAIVIAGVLVANALSFGFSTVHSGLVHMGELIRDGLLQSGSMQ